MMSQTLDNTLKTGSIIVIAFFGIWNLILFFRGSSDHSSESLRVQRTHQNLDETCKLDNNVSPVNWKWILIHHSGVSETAIERLRFLYVKGGFEEIPFHFLIKPDGMIYTVPTWRKQQWCAQTSVLEMNRTSIGICVLGDFSENEPTAHQMASLLELIRHLKSVCNIKNRYIERSSVIDKTQSPGEKFPWRRFLSSLK